jgi:hypothetical protein
MIWHVAQLKNIIDINVFSSIWHIAQVENIIDILVACQGLCHVVQVLISMGIPVKLSVIVQVDNVGAILMSEHVSAISRTKHTNTGYHLVREFVEEGFVKIIFVRSEDNTSDPFTKKIYPWKYL